jgi:hypothetical protein
MKRNSPLIVSFLFAIILGLGVGCAKKPDDAKISSEIQDKFSQDSGLGAKQLSVKAEGGDAGTVDNDAQRDGGETGCEHRGRQNRDQSEAARRKPSAVKMTPPDAALPAASAPRTIPCAQS